MTVQEFLEEEDHGAYKAEGAAWTAEELPCLTDIEEVFRGLPRGKAAGLDHLPAELLAAVPSYMAKLVQPLFLKSLLSYKQTPPVERGGFVFGLETKWKAQ